MALTVAACTATLPGTPLAIDTVSFQSGAGGCAGVGLLPFRIERDGEGLRYVYVATDAAVRLVWPSGYVARLVDGMAIVYGSNGVVIGAGGCSRRRRGWMSPIGRIDPRRHRGMRRHVIFTDAD